jgi:hypothetical protein
MSAASSVVIGSGEKSMALEVTRTVPCAKLALAYGGPRNSICYVGSF